MLVNVNTRTTLQSAITAAQTVLPVISTQGLSLPSGSFAYAELSDGVNSEVVKITAIASGSITVDRAQFGTVARGFVKGVCVNSWTGFGAICELIAQGGCSGVLCVPVSQPTYSMPDVAAGNVWSAIVVFPNATSIDVVKVPSWVTTSISGNSVILSGTAADVADQSIIIKGNGCNNSVSVLNKSVNVCPAVGVAP